jgi:hypothetical protein
VSGTGLGPVTKFSPIYCCGVLCLTRSRVCSFTFFAGHRQCRSESHRTHEQILLSLFFRFTKLGGSGSHIYLLQEQGSLVIPPRIKLKFKLKLNLRPTVSQILISLSDNFLLLHIRRPL